MSGVNTLERIQQQLTFQRSGQNDKTAKTDTEKNVSIRRTVSGRCPPPNPHLSPKRQSGTSWLSQVSQSIVASRTNELYSIQVRPSQVSQWQFWGGSCNGDGDVAAGVKMLNNDVKLLINSPIRGARQIPQWPAIRAATALHCSRIRTAYTNHTETPETAY